MTIYPIPRIFGHVWGIEKNIKLNNFYVPDKATHKSKRTLVFFYWPSRPFLGPGRFPEK